MTLTAQAADVATAIRERRSVKHYDPTFQLPAEHEQLLMSLMQEAPTSFNMQNWRAVIVRNPELRAQIRAAAWNQAQITDASLCVVLCADLNAHARNPERYWANAPEPVQQTLVPMIGKFYEGNPQLQRDEAMRSVGLVGQTLMLAAKGLGYDSCPMIGFDPQQVAQIINLPPDHVIGMIVVVGKAAKPAQAKGGYLPQAEMFLQDCF